MPSSPNHIPPPLLRVRKSVEGRFRNGCLCLPAQRFPSLPSSNLHYICVSILSWCFFFRLIISCKRPSSSFIHSPELIKSYLSLTAIHLDEGSPALFISSADDYLWLFPQSWFHCIKQCCMNIISVALRRYSIPNQCSKSHDPLSCLAHVIENRRLSQDLRSYCLFCHFPRPSYRFHCFVLQLTLAALCTASLRIHHQPHKTLFQLPRIFLPRYTNIDRPLHLTWLWLPLFSKFEFLGMCSCR